MPGVRTAFVLGAGLGTRLRPLTARRPKPLVPLFGKPLITFAFDHLIAQGTNRFVVNTHHCPEAYRTILGEQDGRSIYRDLPVHYRHEPVLLDTGGGIKNAEALIGDEPFFVYNGDVLADFPLQPLLEAHLSGRHLATLVLRSHGGPLHIQRNPDSGLVTDIRHAIGGHHDPSFLFTGISLLSPDIFSHIPSGEIVSIIPIYLQLLQQGARIGGVVIDDGLWFDLGSRTSYLDAHRLLAPGGHVLSHASPGWPRPVHPTARIHPTASLRGTVSIGAGAIVAAGTTVTDSILWEDAVLAPDSSIERCIIRDHESISGQFCDTDF